MRGDRGVGGRGSWGGAPQERRDWNTGSLLPGQMPPCLAIGESVLALVGHGMWANSNGRSAAPFALLLRLLCPSCAHLPLEPREFGLEQIVVLHVCDQQREKLGN